MTVPEQEKLMMVGGSWDGEEIAWRGPSVMMPQRRLPYGVVTEAGADFDPRPLESETYVAMPLNTGRRIYLIVERYVELRNLIAREEAYLERSREYAAEAARTECSIAVNRVFADWAYMAIIDARMLYAQQAALLTPRPRPVEESPEKGMTLH